MFRRGDPSHQVFEFAAVDDTCRPWETNAGGTGAYKPAQTSRRTFDLLHGGHTGLRVNATRPTTTLTVRTGTRAKSVARGKRAPKQQKTVTIENETSETEEVVHEQVEQQAKQGAPPSSNELHETVSTSREDNEEAVVVPQRTDVASRDEILDEEPNDDDDETKKPPEIAMIATALQQLTAMVTGMQTGAPGTDDESRVQQLHEQPGGHGMGLEAVTTALQQLTTMVAYTANENHGSHVDPDTMTVLGNTLQQLTVVVMRLQPAPANNEVRGDGVGRVVRREHDGSVRRAAQYGTADADQPPVRHERDDDDRRAGRYERRSHRRRSAPRRVRDAGSPSSGGSSSSSSDESSDDDRRRGGGRQPRSVSSDESSSSSSSESEEERERRARRRRSASRERRSRRERREQRGRREQRERREEREPREARRQRRDRPPRRKSVKDLELPTFTPSPNASVATWISRVDLALKGAEESGRGTWSDKALYFIPGNKLMVNAAKWWVDMNRRLKERDRPWTYLKKALLRRYCEKLDKSVAEWRVNMRRMLPGETYADCAAGLRETVGRNRVKEQVLLAQFYRNLEKTTRKLVQRHPKSRTLEDAVHKATDIDDPMDSVAQGMVNIGQPWATAPSRFVVPMDGTMGRTNVIPGVSSTGLASMVAGESGNGDSANSDVQAVALFTNPQGVYNAFSGTWEAPPGHVWNGKYWYEPKKTERKRQSAPKTTGSRPSDKTPAVKTKRKREKADSSDDEAAGKPKSRKLKAAMKQTTAEEKRSVSSKHPAGRQQQSSGTRGGGGQCYQCGQRGHWSGQCPNEAKCYACRQSRHFARDCPDTAAKARNHEYLRHREEERKKSAENDDRTP